MEILPQLFEDLLNDLSLIGKSPDCTYEEVIIYLFKKIMKLQKVLLMYDFKRKIK